jgi:hypothetical protein
VKFRSLHKWHLTEPLSGLVFFAQRLDELLFDYTLDSYKPSALNASSLSIEALAVISGIEKGEIEAANLDPVLDELEWSIRQDSVSKSLLDVEVEQYVLKHADTPLNEKKIRLEVLSRTLHSNRYVERCSEQLRKAISLGHKSEINFLAQTLITTLVNRGLSKAFLYQKTQEFFFKGTVPTIYSVDELNGFLQGIQPTTHNFDVFFIVSKDIRRIQRSLDSFSLKILDVMPENVAQIAQRMNLIPNLDESIVQVDNIRSYDCYSARNEAERRIDMLRDLFTLFSHRHELTWREETLISQCCVDAPVVVGTSKSAMQKRVDPSGDFASKRLNSMLGSLGLRYGDTFEKFNRIVDLHGICVTNNVPENQLLNLWISLETLVPAKGGKIGRVVKALEPFVRRTYVRRLVNTALRDLMLWDAQFTRRLLRSVSKSKGRKLSLRLLFVLSLDENRSLRDQLYAALKDFHLLRFRIYSLHKALHSPTVVRELIDSHWRKVEWQIRRIYRTRNSLVHSGEAPSYLGTLIENGHDYLDMVLEEVIDISCGERQIRTLDQAFELEQLLSGSFLRDLAAIANFDAGNIGLLYQA